MNKKKGKKRMALTQDELLEVVKEMLVDGVISKKEKRILIRLVKQKANAEGVVVDVEKEIANLITMATNPPIFPDF